MATSARVIILTPSPSQAVSQEVSIEPKPAPSATHRAMAGGGGRESASSAAAWSVPRRGHCHHVMGPHPGKAGSLHSQAQLRFAPGYQDGGRWTGLWPNTAHMLPASVSKCPLDTRQHSSPGKAVRAHREVSLEPSHHSRTPAHTRTPTPRGLLPTSRAGRGQLSLRPTREAVWEPGAGARGQLCGLSCPPANSANPPYRTTRHRNWPKQHRHHLPQLNVS